MDLLGKKFKLVTVFLALKTLPLQNTLTHDDFSLVILMVERHFSTLLLNVSNDNVD